jgi:hypothetical protein
MKKGKVFNSLRRPKLLRKHVPAAEAGVGVVLLLAILGMGAWLVAQRDTYDPAERDISMEILEAQSVEDNLYKAPLKRWREPGLAEATVVDLGPFDAGILRGGWTSPVSPQTFTPDTLYEKINGQAEQYLKFGFRELTVIVLEHVGEGIGLDVFLYDQETFANSLGVYEEQRGQKEVRLLGDVHYTPHELGAIGTCGRIFFHITGTRSGPTLDAKTQQVLEAIGTLAVPGEIPEGYELFAKSMGIPFGQIGYAPKNVFQFRFARDFWFARPDAGEDWRYFVHVAGSEGEAEELLERLRDAQAEEYEKVDDAVLLHPFLKTYFSVHHAGAHVYGVDNYPDREGVGQAISRLKAALEENR